LKAAQLRAKKNHRRHKRLGQCADCSEKPVKGHTLCQPHLDRRKKISRKNVFRLKNIVLHHYGRHRCAWRGCTVIDADMLTLDHVADDGAKQRKKKRRLGVVLFGWLIKLGFPEGYQVLCGNHQLKKELMRRRGERCSNIIKRR
jgi:hypothetical protein